MPPLRRMKIMKTASCLFQFCRTKPQSVILFSIFSVLLVVYYHDCSRDPADLLNMKHGFIKVIPEHHLNVDLSQLQPAVKTVDTLQCSVPPIVHYYWCHTTAFQYQHYLSVLSAYKLLKPTETIFHYNTLPMRDRDGYYQYYEDLLRDLPNFFPELIEDQRACSDEREVAMTYVSEMLNKQGGVSLGVNVILSPSALQYMDKLMSVYHSDGQFALSAAMFLSPGALHTTGADTSKTSSSPIKCASKYKFSHQACACVLVSEEIFPYQIIDIDSDFGELARFIGYGHTQVPTPIPQDSFIPNIVQYVWLGKRSFDFFSYLSLLSSVYIQKAEVVYIHGDYEPLGDYWEKAKKIPQVKFILREFPQSIYGNTIKSPSHASDILRMDILLRYGGIYTDWDLIWIKALSKDQRKYECIASFDWPENGRFRDTFNLGILGAKKGARFVQFMIESFRFYVDQDFGYNAIRIPYKVYEQHPESIHVDRHLQVICFEEHCHPVWQPGYKKDLYNKHSKRTFNWQNDTNVVHWTRPDPREFRDKETLLSSSGMFADIGKNVLLHAGEI